jgi:hypothetical protein
MSPAEFRLTGARVTKSGYDAPKLLKEVTVDFQYFSGLSGCTVVRDAETERYFMQIRVELDGGKVDYRYIPMEIDIRGGGSLFKPAFYTVSVPVARRRQVTPVAAAPPGINVAEHRPEIPA